eukprot:TRINITY_DN27_c0_g1_i5.p2 TRINITY_DN27_c0_g1~~TRINITY_DN27_c0_g1_i5.p2  ORF type:complete len:457 (-),score=8.02 TRINITY_DN27_c0_g1_i5:1854-3224(-)
MDYACSITLKITQDGRGLLPEHRQSLAEQLGKLHLPNRPIKQNKGSQTCQYKTKLKQPMKKQNKFINLVGFNLRELALFKEKLTATSLCATLISLVRAQPVTAANIMGNKNVKRYQSSDTAKHTAQFMQRSPKKRRLSSQAAVGRTIYAIADKLQGISTEEMDIILDNEVSDVNRSGSSLQTAETALKSKNELRNPRRGISASVLGLQQAIPIYNPTRVFGDYPVNQIDTQQILYSMNSILGILGAPKSAEELIKEESDEIIPAWKRKVKLLDPDTQSEIGKLAAQETYDIKDRIAILYHNEILEIWNDKLEVIHTSPNVETKDHLTTLERELKCYKREQIEILDIPKSSQSIKQIQLESQQRNNWKYQRQLVNQKQLSQKRSKEKEKNKEENAADDSGSHLIGPNLLWVQNIFQNNVGKAPNGSLSTFKTQLQQKQRPQLKVNKQNQLLRCMVAI